MTPKPEYRHVTTAEVETAIASGDYNNPIVLEIIRLSTAYSAAYAHFSISLGRVPDAVLKIVPGCPLEAVALRIFIDEMTCLLATEKPGPQVRH